MHIITGKTDDEQEGDGDFTPKAERYRRAAEYLKVMKLAWANDKPFDFAGEFYRVNGAHSDMRPLQKPHPLLFFGGASEGALEMGAKLCDVYAIYAEPLASTGERLKEFRARAAAFGRVPGFNVSVRPIIAASEGAAWDKANKILAAMTGESGKKGWSRQEAKAGPVDNAGRRLMSSRLKAMSMTSACGCRSRARPARSAIHPAWSARPSRSRKLFCAITGSASVRF